MGSKTNTKPHFYYTQENRINGVTNRDKNMRDTLTLPHSTQTCWSESLYLSDHNHYGHEGSISSIRPRGSQHIDQCRPKLTHSFQCVPEKGHIHLRTSVNALNRRHTNYSFKLFCFLLAHPNGIRATCTHPQTTIG